MFDLFRRRRERESAIPASQSAPPLTSQVGQQKPVGQPVGQAFPAAGQPQSFDFTGAGLDVGSVMAAISQAFRQGGVEFTQGQPQVVDLRGSGLREEIMEVMRQHGVDPESGQANINAADLPGLQQQIMEALTNAGVDVGAAGMGDGNSIQIQGGDGGGE